MSNFSVDSVNTIFFYSVFCEQHYSQSVDKPLYCVFIEVDSGK